MSIPSPSIPPSATARAGTSALRSPFSVQLVPAGSALSLALLGFAAIAAAAAALVGSLANATAIPEWYDTLRKPGFTPPNAAFGIVWPILYALIAFSGWRLLRVAAAEGDLRPVGLALLAFVGQLCLNAGWSWAFFGARAPLFGLVVIVLLDLAVLDTIRRAWQLDRPAALALLPYLAWILFATALNASIWWLNR